MSDQAKYNVVARYRYPRCFRCHGCPPVVPCVAGVPGVTDVPDVFGDRLIHVSPMSQVFVARVSWVSRFFRVSQMSRMSQALWVLRGSRGGCVDVRMQ